MASTNADQEPKVAPANEPLTCKSPVQLLMCSAQKWETVIWFFPCYLTLSFNASRAASYTWWGAAQMPQSTLLGRSALKQRPHTPKPLLQRDFRHAEAPCSTNLCTQQPCNLRSTWLHQPSCCLTRGSPDAANPLLCVQTCPGLHSEALSLCPAAMSI